MDISHFASCWCLWLTLPRDAIMPFTEGIYIYYADILVVLLLLPIGDYPSNYLIKKPVMKIVMQQLNRICALSMLVNGSKRSIYSLDYASYKAELFIALHGALIMVLGLLPIQSAIVRNYGAFASGHFVLLTYTLAELRLHGGNIDSTWDEGVRILLISNTLESAAGLVFCLLKPEIRKRIWVKPYDAGKGMVNIQVWNARALFLAIGICAYDVDRARKLANIYQPTVYLNAHVAQ